MFGRGIRSNNRHEHGAADRQVRLDPVRWRRPGRGMLIRAGVVAALLATAATVAWARPTGCAPIDAVTTGRAANAAAGPGSAATGSAATAGGRGRAGSAIDGSGSGTRGSGTSNSGPSSSGALIGDSGRATSDSGPSPQGSGEGGRSTDGAASAPGAASARPALPPGTVGVAVRLAEPATLRLIRVGDRVDVIGVDPNSGVTSRVADDALVLDVAGADDPTSGGLLLALDRAEAGRAVAAPERTRFAVLIHPPR